MADRDLLLSLAGPLLASYIDHPDTIEVMVNDNHTAFLKRFGVGTVEVEHPGEAILDRFLAAVAHEQPGKAWRETAPELSIALDDIGWRIEAGRPPISPALFMALRKHPAQIFPLEDYVAKGILTPQQSTLLAQAMREKKRLVIGGGVGSAKSSLTNALLDVIRDTDERVLIVEDDPELHCAVRNCVRRHVVRGINTMRELVHRSLRLNPDRIIIGEVRGGEALEMLKAFRTGHSGLTTVHADTVNDIFARLEECVLEEVPTSMSRMIGGVIDLVAHMEKSGSSSWRCTGILAVEGFRQGRYHTRPLA
jgi:type IV secretion system protein TrbB